MFDARANKDRNVGAELVGYMVELAGLRSTDAVLETGCGIASPEEIP